MKKKVKIDKNTFFREATMRICSSLNPDTALHQLLDYIQDFIPATGLTFGLIDFSSSIFEITAEVSLDKTNRLCPFYIDLPKENLGELFQTWQNDKGIHFFLNDPDEQKSWEKRLRNQAWPPESSVLIIKLNRLNQNIGAFAVYSQGRNRYKEEHLRLIKMLHDPLAVAMSNALHYQEVIQAKEMLADDNRYLHQQLLQVSGEAIVGTDSGLKEVMEKVRQVARLDSPVLLLGETGVGKEVIANAVHQYSDRRAGPFIKVNCGAIPESLMDSELFGHEKGAFTGAITRKRGRFERADNGTIFLDEIGELLPAAQIRLLRVLQHKEIERVGGTSTIPINARIISATHRNPAKMVEEGQFREDLWFRLNVFPVMIPPLRDRKTDIPELVYYFIKRKTAELKIHNPPAIDPDDLNKLMDYHWPGNIRELENIVERALIQSRGKNNQRILSFENPWLTFEGDKKNEEFNPDDLKENFLSLEEVDRLHIRKALTLTGGKVYGPNGAAQLLHLNHSTLRAKMRKLGITTC